MKASKSLAGLAGHLQNQLIPFVMTVRLKGQPEERAIAWPEQPLGRARVGVALLALVCASAVTLGVVTSSSPNPLPLIVLSALAVVGLFSLLAVSLGHVRLASRTDDRRPETIADAWPEAVLITTRAGATVYANGAFETFVPQTAGAGIVALEAMLAGESSACEALFRLVRAGGRGEARVEEIDLTGATFDAPRRHVRISVCAFALGEASVERFVLWRLSDVTKERADERRKVGDVQRRMGGYDAAPVGLLTVRADGIVTQMNATMAQMTRRSLDIAGDDGLSLATVFSPAGAKVLTGTLARASSGMMTCALDLSVPDGRRLPVRVLCPPPAASDAAAARDERVLVVLRNEWADPGLATNGEATDPGFARHFASAPFGIATVTASGHVARANTAFSQMVMDGTGGIDGRAVDVLCSGAPDDMRQAISQALDDALAGLSGVAPLDFAVGPKGEFGRRIYVTPMLGASAGREAAIVYVVDTTEQKALEAKFAQSQKMEAVGKLAGGIAHDFNNVLTAIIGSADLMLQTHRASDASHKDIQNIKQSANRAAGLVRKLMAFSRQQTLQLEVLHLGDVVADLRPMLTTSLGEKIAIAVTADRDLWYVKADRTQVDQVLVNLAVNAQHAMANGGMFAIRTRNVTEREVARLANPGMTVGEYVLIEVEDTGTGMPPEVLTKIFEPFFTTKDVGKGTGLGLATVYGIIKQSSGFIFPESTPGRGTTFRIYLPRAQVTADSEAAALKATKKEATPDDLTGTATVLIVEDEDMVRSVAVRSLTRLGYRVLEAGNGYEALDVLAEATNTVDIVVSDVVMPEMDGPTFLKEVRKTRPDLKIIFVSGHTNDAFKTSLDDNEVFAFLQKPFSLPQLAAKVKEELGRA
jgi:two-component system cell cycle sensor histidine kinase/response regulator CckA